MVRIKEKFSCLVCFCSSRERLCPCYLAVLLCSEFSLSIARRMGSSLFFFGQSESCLLWHLSLVATVEHSICRLRFLFSWVLILSWDVVWSLFAGLARFLCNEISLSVEKKIFTIFLNKITSHSISLMNYCALKVMIKYVTLKKLISGEFLLKFIIMISLLKSFINI